MRPGPRAKNIRPMMHGDEYTYEVDKYWRVVESTGSELVIKTPGGKVHRISANDPHIIKPSFIKTLLMRHRFPEEEVVTS